MHNSRHIHLPDVLSVAIVLTVVLAGCTGDAPTPTESAREPTTTATPSDTPTPSATPAPTPTNVPSPTATQAPPTASPAPTYTPTAVPTPTPSLLEPLEQAGERVAGLRGLEPVVDPDVRLMTASELEAEIGDGYTPLASTMLLEQRSLMQELGLAPEGEEALDSHTSLPLGAYSPFTRQLTLRLEEPDKKRNEPTRLEEIVFAHEYTHMLQDQRLNTTALLDRTERLEPAPANAAIAFLAMMEGDASLTQELYARRVMGLDADEVPRAITSFTDGRIAAIKETPNFLAVHSEILVYLEGREFARSLWEDGGFDAVDEAYESPPSTTEQVMHPDKYRSGETGADLALPDIAQAAGQGWAAPEGDLPDRLGNAALGELFLLSWLLSADRQVLDSALESDSPAAEFRERVDESRDAAAGWNGDTFTVIEGPDGERAAALLIAWDDPTEDPAEFTDMLSARLDDSTRFERSVQWDTAGMAWVGPSGILGLGVSESGRVAVAVGPDVEVAEDIMDALLKPS